MMRRDFYSFLQQLSLVTFYFYASFLGPLINYVLLHIRGKEGAEVKPLVQSSLVIVPFMFLFLNIFRITPGK